MQLLPTDPTLFHREHGGADGQGLIKYDFSTNANPLGPPDFLVEALKFASRVNYPDPKYCQLREHLADWHHTEPTRVLIAGSAGEWIWRLTHWMQDKQQTRRVWIPVPGYGEYQEAARRLGQECLPYQRHVDLIGRIQPYDLLWSCEPVNPTGELTLPAVLQHTIEQVQCVDAQIVLDLAYAPLLLEEESFAAKLDTANVWRMFTPNKACALTGIRGAYVIAPPGMETVAQSLEGFAPSWVMGVDGEVLLKYFVSHQTSAWLAECRAILKQWKSSQIASLENIGWQFRVSKTHFMLAKPLVEDDMMMQKLQQLRQYSIKLRDATSFGFPGYVRLRSMPPVAQEALLSCWK